MSARPSPAARGPRRLRVVVDPGARSQPALDNAARLARAFLRAGVDVHACDFRDDLDARGRGVAALRRRWLADGEDALRRLARTHLGTPRATVGYELGHPRHERLLARVRCSRPALVLIDSHFHPDARCALFTAADWPLIRGRPVPQPYAKPGRWPVAPRIAAAVDRRHAADRRAPLDAAIVARARALARGLNGSPRVVHAWSPQEPAPGGGALPGLPTGTAVDAGRWRAEVRAARAVAAVMQGGARARGEVVLLRGAALDTLPGFVEVEGPDVLVLGAVSRGRLYEVVIGATAERLLERVPCDRLVVKAGRARRRGVRVRRDGRGPLPV